MNNLQRIGGAAALIEAATYLIGIIVLVTILLPAGYVMGENDPIQSIAFLVENQTFMHLWHLIIYIINGIFLVVLVQALYERLKVDTPAMAQTTAAFGLIWAGLVIASGLLLIKDAGVVAELYETDPAQAATVWIALSAVENALGGGIELPGGLWLLLVSWAALRSGALPRALNLFGLVIGGAGILMVLPALDTLGAVFGLGSIVWFIWVGIVMLRYNARPATQQPETLLAHHKGAI
ncbi:MAG: DUF4386 family protein [Chloroflexi bacterium]|nr:MAG: DUF4386 family protein [Chloroflexota bacterium]